jgi:hypothetical protein
MRVIDRDLIRGGHYGQRSCEPRLKAEHMGAPTNAAYVKKSPCQLGAVHTWGKSGRRKLQQPCLFLNPKQTFATVIRRVAKGLFDYLVGAAE